MANELIFNLDLNLDFPLSDYAFLSGNAGVLYFRAFRNNYIQDWQNSDNLVFSFQDREDSNISFVHTLSSQDLVPIETENLFKLTLNPSMLAREGVYTGNVKINNSTKTLGINIVVFGSTTIEMSTLLLSTRKYQEQIKSYLLTAKKDMLDAPNGLAILDNNLKLRESYLPSSYRTHINTEISKAEAHSIKIDSEGIAWVYNGTSWVQWAGQPSQSTVTPPSIVVNNGLVTISYDPKQTVARQKWAEGNQPVSYFLTNGNNFNGNSFRVTKSGTYTLYYRDGQGADHVQNFEVLETDIPYPLPTVKATNGVVNITQYDPSKVLIQKWSQGVQDVSFFQNQGTVISNNKFNVSAVGSYTLYYKLLDGRETVMTIVIDESMLPQVLLPKIEVKNGIATITYDPSMNIAESKWDFGTQDIPYFSSNGFPITNNSFEVFSIGLYTLYFRTVNNDERVLTFDVNASQLKNDPAVNITINQGLATIGYPSNIQISLSKWDIGVRDISYFVSNGKIILNNTFTVTQVGEHSLYYKTVDNKEYIKIFTVSVADLPPSIVPQYTISNGALNISVSDESIYTNNRFTWQKVETDYFTGGGASNPVVNWKIPFTQKGWLTHYYSTDTSSGVYQIEIKDEDLLHTVPSIRITDGLARVTQSQPEGVTVTSQKWATGERNVSYFQSSGVNVVDNKFYVTVTGTHTLYYKLSHGGEYVRIFNVSSPQLEQPFNPPTISTSLGVVSPVFESDYRIALKKWGVGTLSIPFFQNAGTVFTTNFTVPSAGQYTIYVKLANEREYVYPFSVTEAEMQPAFYTPQISIVRGEVTVTYDPSLSVQLNKWAYGNNPVSFFETGGNPIVNNKFTVATAGQHTLYTVLTGGYKHITVFEVKAEQLPSVDPPPTITTANGIVTIILNSSIVVTEQKWERGLQDKEYFQTGGNVFTGNTFNVSVADAYSYYYKNSYNEEYLFHFNVTENQLPFYPVTITVFDALMTLEFSSPLTITETKIASGSQNVDYFDTQGDLVVNREHPITSAGTYTLYWEQEDSRKFIQVFQVGDAQVVKHASPQIATEGQNVTVTYTSDVESLVTEKKYDAGDRDSEWFTANGSVLTSNQFTVSSYGDFTYFYKYRNRGYTIKFTVADYSYLVPITSIADGDEFVFGGKTWTRIGTDPDGILIADETPFAITTKYGSSGIITKFETDSIGYNLLQHYYNTNDYRSDELSSIRNKTWNNGTLDDPTSNTFLSQVGTISTTEATTRNARMLSKGLDDIYWTSTYYDGLNAYAYNIATSSYAYYPVEEVKQMRGQMVIDTNAKVEKAPNISIAQGVVTITD